jgi:hypothetical protein
MPDLISVCPYSRVSWPECSIASLQIKPKAWAREVVKIKELTLVNDCFYNEWNQFTKPKAWQLADSMDRH